MKRIIFFLGVLFILSACGNGNANGEDSGYKFFYSDDKDTLSLLVVDTSLDNFSINELETKGIKNLISKVHVSTSLKLKDNKYNLKLENKPAYVVFSNDEMLYTTYTKDELFSFLKDYKN
jgi:hypothetical protein